MAILEFGHAGERDGYRTRPLGHGAVGRADNGVALEYGLGHLDARAIEGGHTDSGWSTLRNCGCRTSGINPPGARARNQAEDQGTREGESRHGDTLSMG